MMKALDDGIILELTDYVKNNMPAYWSKVQEMDVEKEIMTDDGQILSIASLNDRIIVDRGPVIRQDWLDALGLEAPTTYDEWYDVGLAMLSAYDIDYAFYISNVINPSITFSAGYDLPEMDFTVSGSHFYQVDGEVTSAYVSENFKEYLTLLANAPMPAPPPKENSGEGKPPAGMPGPGMRTGTYLMKLIRRECEKRGVTILLETRAVDLELEGGKIAAVLAEGPDGPVKVSCRAVVLATGSWISNQKYLEMASPVFARLDAGKPVPSGHRNSNYTGDGIPLAEKAGAFVDYDSFCIRAMGPGLVAEGGRPIFPKGQMAEAMARSPYAIQVDEQGFRYTCEPSGSRFPAEESAHVVLAHNSIMPCVVFDLNTAKYTAAQAKKNLVLGKEGGMGGPARVTLEPEQVQEDLEQESFIQKADTIEALAEKLGLPAENLRETVDTYNRSCENGFDTDCFKEPEYLIPMTGPFYGFTTALNTDGAFGGVPVNCNIQALRKDGTPVEGLWVPGDFSSSRFINDGGLKRQILNDLAWAFSSGFIAGEQAANYLTR